MSLSAKHIPALDGVRGLAAISVVICHYWGGKQNPHAVVRFIAEGLNFGWAGVSLFFVLSGFLISGILVDGFDKQHWWRRFYWRRSLRIFPLYYFALALAVVMAVCSFGSRWPLSSIVPYAIYFQNIYAVSALFPRFPKDIALSHFWSLAVEEQFYLIWPFVLVWMNRSLISARRMCVLIWLFSFLFRVSIFWMGSRDIWAIGFLFARAGELAMGAYLALAIRDKHMDAVILRHARPIFIASVFAILAVIVWSKGTDMRAFPMATVGILVNALLFCSLIALCLKTGMLASVFSMGWLRWIGRISYGIYVYHMLLVSQFEWIATRLFPNLGHNAHLIVVAFVAAAGTLAVATISFYGFENRFLRLKSRG